ncbi:MAG: extracellular solute-binding protein [Defluviitaleaceae bacterium]|nr:extracellular solute-binding protein [Defluviitaleaceae bacterium]
MKRRIFSVLALLIVATLVVSACGGSGSGNATSDPTTAPTVTTAPAAPDTSGGDDETTTDAATSDADADDFVSPDQPPVQTGNTLVGLDFGGATLKMGVPWHDDGYFAMIPGFENAYNCTINYVEYGWADYEEIATATIAGDPFDILYAHHNFYPDIIISDVALPLDEYIKYDDWAIPGEPGGLLTNITDLFKWNGKIYFVGSNKTLQTMCLYYNKLKFDEAGLDDPVTLWRAGNWTWAKFMEMARQVTDPANDTYFVCNLARTGEWLSITGTAGINVVQGVPQNNLDSTEFFGAMEAFKEIVSGPNAINAPGLDEQALRDGIVYMAAHTSEVAWWFKMLADESTALNNSFENVGMVPFPMHPNNTRGYPSRVMQGWGAAKGTKFPNAGIAWALYEGTVPKGYFYEDEFPVHQASLQLFDDLANSTVFFGTPTGFSDSEGVGLFSWDVYGSIFDAATNGGDIAQAINDAMPALNKIIADTIAASKN